MPSIDCSVNSCSYNADGCCCAGCINVGGQGATSEDVTCCGTYLNKSNYSDLADFTENRGEPDSILCRVNTCVYHRDDHCTLDHIEVGCDKEVEIYTETCCRSFEQA